MTHHGTRSYDLTLTSIEATSRGGHMKRQTPPTLRLGKAAITGDLSHSFRYYWPLYISYVFF